MNSRGERRRPPARFGQARGFARLVRAVAPLLLALLVAACSVDGSTLRRAPTPTSPPPAEQQDIITAPNATPGSAPATGATPPPRPTLAPARAHQSLPPGVPAPPSASGRVILVSLERQQLWAYENGALAFTVLVETGRPELPTPTGVYNIFLKSCSDLRWQSNTGPTSMHNPACGEHAGDGYQEMFTSPWPKGSPNWYAPTHINYALAFKDGGFYLHDAWWHQRFGPGSNVPHQLSNGDWETGSHGCVGMTTADTEKLYRWAPIGTAVYIRQGV